MNHTEPMSKEAFIKRLTNLCLRSGMPSFPKDDTDQQILLKSAVLMMGEAEAFSEKEVNLRLEAWIMQVCPIQNFDRASLRRYLVDADYLTRSSDGARYQVAHPGPRAQFFDAGVEQIDILQEIEAAREEMARRKREYLEKNKGR
jgi:hypothetical protein